MTADSERLFSLADQASTDISLGTGYHLYSNWPRSAESFHGDESVEAAIATSRRLINSDRAAQTIDKYARDFALFAYWVSKHRPQNAIIPTHPALLGIYIGYLSNRGLSKGRILNYIAAIQFANSVVGHKIPINAGAINREIRGLRREVEQDRTDRPALRQEDATAMLLKLGPANNLFDCRERALMAFGWTSALRRSNIARLRVRDVTIRWDDLNQNRFLEVFVATSKSDQERKGRYLRIPEMPGNHPLCAVRAIEEWIERAGITDQPESALFRSFTLARNVRERRLTANGIGGQDVNRAIKRMAKATGRSEALTAHALRRGFATSADEKGVRRSIIRDHGGWKSDAMIDRYTRVNADKDNAIAEIFGRKQGR